MNSLGQGVRLNQGVFCCRGLAAVLYSLIIGSFVTPFLIFVFPTVQIGAEPTEGSFDVLLQQSNMIFTQPEGFSALPVRENRDVKYDYALKHQKQKLEVRYFILPLAENKALDSSVFWQSNTMAVLRNISSGKDSHALDNVYRVPDEALKVYNADAGAFAKSSTHQSDFGMGYKQCSMTSLYSKGKAQAMVFFLYDELAPVEALIGKALYSLRFDNSN